MKLVAAGACVTLAGLALLMAMVVRVVEPGLGLSFLAYAALFAGMMIAIIGLVRRARGGR
jgi:hypothetical protein